MSHRIPLIILTVVLLQACSGDQAAAPAKKRPTESHNSARSVAISCDEYFSELRAAILGHLRGTEHIGLVSVVTPVTETTYASTTHQGPVEIPASICSAFGKSLRKRRQTHTDSPFTLAPACATLVERIDTDCLVPLVERSQALSSNCSQTLIGLSGSRDDLARLFADNDYCVNYP